MSAHSIDFTPSHASMSQYTTFAGDYLNRRHIWEDRSINPVKRLSAAQEDKLLRCFKGSSAFISVILKNSIVQNRAASDMTLSPSPLLKAPHSSTTRDIRKTVIEEENTQIV